MKCKSLLAKMSPSKGKRLKSYLDHVLWKYGYLFTCYALNISLKTLKAGIQETTSYDYTKKNKLPVI